MKFSLTKLSGYSLCRVGGLYLAVFMLAAMSVISVSGRLMNGGSRSFTADTGAKGYNSSQSAVTEITVTEPVDRRFRDSEKLKKAYKTYKEIIESKNKPDAQGDQALPPSTDTQSTTSTTLVIENEQTTVTTTVPSQTSPTTTASRQPDDESPRVSNAKQPFNYNDVSSIASALNTLEDFIRKLSPELISWDAGEFSENGCIKVTLESDYGSIVLDVKSLDGLPSEEAQYGSVGRDEIASWQWLSDNRSAGCNISSVTWLSPKFGISPVRGIGIGAGLAQLTDNYLCVNGGATTLYKASDVIEDQDKLNAILAAENLYTFVGGRVYSIGSYLDKYYNGREHSFQFEDCDYIVQYGCNSIMEHNYTTGSWIIEYAVREDVIVGINFMNKSYYKNDQKTAISTNIPSTGSEPGVVTTQTETTQSVDPEPKQVSEVSSIAPFESSDDAPLITTDQDDENDRNTADD